MDIKQIDRWHRKQRILKKLKGYEARLDTASSAASIVQKKKVSSAKKEEKEKMLRRFNKIVELIKIRTMNILNIIDGLRRIL